MNHGFNEIIVGVLLFFAVSFYILAVIITNHRFKKWPFYRIVLWVAGIACAGVSLIGPVAKQAHMNFSAHMSAHLLLGMLAPLLLVLAKPVTVLLRALPVRAARRLSWLLKSRPIRFLCHPITASLLNVGGLWLLYTTPLFQAMHHSTLLYIIVHFHLFVAGYLFTASMIYLDPTPHRHSFVYRSVILILALAAHGILSKTIYAYPPTGILTPHAQSGGMLMYYGGDAIDLILIFILCSQWFQATKPRKAIKIAQ